MRKYISGRQSRRMFVLAAAAAATMAWGASARATQYTWTPTASDTWSLGTAWTDGITPGTAPASAVDTRLTFVAANGTVVTTGHVCIQ